MRFAMFAIAPMMALLCHFSQAQSVTLGQIADVVHANSRTVSADHPRNSAPLTVVGFKYDDNPDKFDYYFPFAIKAMSSQDLEAHGFTGTIDPQSEYIALGLGIPFGPPDTIGTRSGIRLLRVDKLSGEVFWVGRENEFRIVELKPSTMALGGYTAIRFGIGSGTASAAGFVMNWVQGLGEDIPEYLSTSPITGGSRKPVEVAKPASPAPCEEPLSGNSSEREAKPGFFERMRRIFGS
ncbi:MAG: hypothetical protein AB7F86_18185 [Bdellovibrionales bacterium]